MHPVKINDQGIQEIIHSIVAIAKMFFDAVVAHFTRTITFQEIVRWFHEHKSLKLANKNYIAFTLLSTNYNNEYVVCQGIFDKQQGEIIAGEKLQGQKIDPELLAVHQGKTLVIYE
jgi:hypothetical protein